MKSSQDKTITSSEDECRTTGPESDVFVMPATPCQTRFWLLHKMHPGNHSLNMPIAWTCRGRFSPDVAAAALKELVRRHESLRTIFEEVDGQLSQVIHSPIEVPLPIDDLRHLPKDAQRRKADEIINQQARIQIDMEKGPLLFARAIQMGADEHILLLTIHHSVCDGWSNGVVLRDFAAIYDGLMRQVPAALPELPIQFGDFAVWLDKWRKGNESAAYLDYWRKALGGDFEPLRIQRDFPGSGVEEQGNIETLLLTPDLVRQARDFCAVRGVTLYMLMLSVYAAMLHRLTGQGDILIGTPCANRRQETENLIGPFSNPQVIRVRIEKEDTLGSIVESVRNWTVGALAHQDLPFEDLNSDEFFCHDKNHISLQVYFIFQKAFMQAQKTPSLEIVPLRSVSPGTTFDLMLSIVERTEGPRLQLEYNPGFFRVSTIQRILNLFVTILESTLSNAESPAQDAAKDETGRHLMAGSNGIAEREAAEEADNRNLHLNDGVNPGTPEAEKRSEEYVAPRDALEAQIAKIWETAIGVTNLSIRDSFFDLGGRSLAAMQIISRINKTYSLNFGLASLFSGHTVERMAGLVTQRLSANGSSSIVPMKPGGTAAPLFIIHGAGGNVIRFYQLAMLVGTNHPIYGIQAQSLLAGQPALLRLEDQAAFYLSEIQELQPKGPYYFLGYSFGGTIALEIANQLRTKGEHVELLGMLDSRQRDCVLVAQHNDSVRVQVDRRIARFLGNLSDLSLRERVEYLRKKLFTRTLRRIYSLAVALGFRSVPSFMKSTDDITWVAAMNYQPLPWSGHVTLFRTTVQPDPRLPLDLGWGPLASGGVEVVELPGDHDLVFREPNIQVLAAELRACLERSEAVRSGVVRPVQYHSSKAGVRMDEPAAVTK
jgi:thioesterase domain-containing protein